MPDMTQQIPMLSTRAAVQPQTYNEEARTVDLVWTTGAQVRRFDWMEGPYLEELSLDQKSVRMDRLNTGAPLLANHDSRSLDAVIGVVEKAWIDGNEGRATVRFSDREDVQPIISDVRAGILRNISVGYQSEHTQNESLDIFHFSALAERVINIDWDSLPTDRDPSVKEEKEWGNWGKWSSTSVNSS